MRREPIRDIAGPVGRLEALLEQPALTPGQALRAAVVFAHPHPLHGGTMHTKAVYRGTKALASLGLRGAAVQLPRGRPERGLVRQRRRRDRGFPRRRSTSWRRGTPRPTSGPPASPSAPYVSLTAGARDDRVSTLIGIAPALHMYDFTAVKASAKPKDFVQGERDELCPLAHMQAFFDDLPAPKQLAVVRGANHLFNGQVEEVGAALVRLLATEQP